MSKSYPMQPPRTDNPYSAYKGRPKNFTVSDESQHFEVCEECGQAFDRRELGEVFHHMQPGHNRLPENG